MFDAVVLGRNLTLAGVIIIMSKSVQTHYNGVDGCSSNACNAVVLGVYEQYVRLNWCMFEFEGVIGVQCSMMS